ncbi:MAG: GAF domain-containing protein, partial [Deltaproteobacteria bacterium]
MTVTALQRAARRALKVSIGAIAGGVACAVVAAGGVDGAAVLAERPSLSRTMVAAAIAALVAIAVIRRVQFAAPSARAQRVSFWLAAASDLADLELALTLVAGIHVVIAMTGGLGSPAYPLLYGLVAFAMTVLARPGAVATLAAALLLEAAVLARGRITEAAVLAAGIHAAYLMGAAAAHVVLLRGLTSRYRRRRAARLDEELTALRDSARDYRLIAAALGPSSRAPRGREEEERLLAIGGVGMIGDAASWVLGTLKRSLAATTVALLWLDEDGERVKLKEVVSDADDIPEAPRLSSAGILGAVVHDRQALLCAATKPGQLPYYESGRGGVALVAVPLIEQGHLRGILAADREAPFGEADRDLLADASAQVLRVVQSEQVFRAVERAKYEHERFYQARCGGGDRRVRRGGGRAVRQAEGAAQDRGGAGPRRGRGDHRSGAADEPGVQGQRGAGGDGGEEPALPAGGRRAARGVGAELHAQGQDRRRAVAAGAAAAGDRRAGGHVDIGGAGREA